MAKRSSVSGLWWLCCLCVLGAGCEPSALTQVMVVVESDLQVPAALDRIEVEVRGPDGDVRIAQGLLDGPTDLPSTLALVHAGGPLGDITVIARGFRAGSVVVERMAIFEFVPGEVRILRLGLERSCMDVSCASPEQTCATGFCRDARVDASELEPYAPLDPMDGGAGLDASAADAGPSDAGPEEADQGRELDLGSPVDMTVDMGGPDPVCADGAEGCGTGGSACSCEACECGVRCSSDCVVRCDGSERCEVDAASIGGDVELDCVGSSCSVEARGAANVEVSARDEADVWVDCSMAARCAVDCEAGSRCTVRCQAASDCAIETCEGTRRSCPRQTITCDAPCP